MTLVHKIDVCYPCLIKLQVVWATSNNLGCGATHCSNVTFWGNVYFLGNTYFLVCNYGPGLVFVALTTQCL